jgi:hypothetical protein
MPEPDYRERSQRQSRLDGVVGNPDHIFVPRSDSDRLRERVRAALEAGDWAAADDAIATLETLRRTHGDRHRQSVMASRYRSPEAVIAEIERDGRNLKLREDGAILCTKGYPAEPARLALLYYRDAISAILAAREQVVVLAPPPANASAA